jgi:hypothetical protein
VNGIQVEDLLAICEHRLEGFMAGPFPHTTTQEALEYVQLARESLHARTKDRQARQVEGRNVA